MSDDSALSSALQAKVCAPLPKGGAAQVNEVIDRWSSVALTAEARKQVFFQRMCEGDVESGTLVEKIIARRCVMLGLHAPQTVVLKIVDEAVERDRTERIATQKKEDVPTTH